MKKPTIGFIGLGMMGAAMVQCLQKKGYQVNVIANRSRTQIDKAVERGAIEMKTTSSLTKASDIIMLCMDTSASVEKRIYGDDGILNALDNSQIVIDFGTSLPDSTKKISSDIHNKGGAFLDAPLGRTPAHAVDGLLNIMCSGDKAAFDQVKPILNDLGENIFYLGASGSGHAIKLINNFFGMTLASAMSEAFAMGDKAGIDRQKLYEVMSAGPLHSMMMDLVKAYAVDGDISKLEFSVKNASKDVGYVLSMTENMEFQSFIAPATANLLSQATEAGYGENNVPAILDYLNSKNKAA